MKALNDINLELRKGEVLVLVGENGECIEKNKEEYINFLSSYIQKDSTNPALGEKMQVHGLGQ